MLITLNGREVEVPAGSTLGAAIAGEHYLEGTAIALTRPASSIQRETPEFEVVTSRGSFVIRLNDSDFARRFRELLPRLAGTGIRWQSSKVTAYGSFPSDVEVSREQHFYSRYDCYFALGGFDNSTTYFMIARVDHNGAYGTAGGKFGRVTRGRHLLQRLREGDRITEIRPVVLELSEKDAFITTDLSTPLEDGMSVETYVAVELDRRSPVSCEQFLVVAGDGRLSVTDNTATYAANSQRLDVTLVPEATEVREPGHVTVRHTGPGTGRLYLYRERRQLSPAHNLVGKVTSGLELVRLAAAPAELTVVPNPARIMTIGMTQAEAAAFLAKAGCRQKRTGLTDDAAVVVEQEPELTMEIPPGGEVETFGVTAEEVVEWELDDVGSPKTSHYLRKMTGLDHKPIGTMKVFFTFPEMPMITFEGNAKEASVLLPEKSFAGEASFRGQVAVTNMSRPNRGTIGIRLEGSEEFGPTGEEAYGTNVAGRIVSDLDLLMNDIKDGDIVYLREVRGAPRPAPVVEAAPEEAPQEVPPEPAGPINPFEMGAVRREEEKATARAKKKGGRPRAKRPKQG